MSDQGLRESDAFVGLKLSARFGAMRTTTHGNPRRPEATLLLDFDVCSLDHVAPDDGVAFNQCD